MKIYRGVHHFSVKTFKSSSRGRYFGEGWFSVTTNKKVAQKYSKWEGNKKGKVIEGKIDLQLVKIKRIYNVNSYYAHHTLLFGILRELSELGFDESRFVNIDNEQEIVIFNSKIITV